MSLFLNYAERLMARPTAPFREQWVAAELDRILAEIPAIRTDIDRFGNRIVRLTRGDVTGTVPTYVAHLDHPGFLLNPDGAVSRGGGLQYDATFEGRVLSDYFPGTRVRLYRHETDPGVTGVVRRAAEESAATDNRGIILETQESADGATMAMWDVEPFRIVDGMLHSRACDDLAGCAAILAALHTLAASEEPVDMAVIFSRAEEAGFCGILCMIAEEQLHPLLSEDAVFISVENSSERLGVSCGDGAIIRLGDRASTFDGPTVDWMWRVAREHEIKARRMLMDGGTCEATVFARKGYRAGGLCIPLRHYHNMDKTHSRIAAEAINIGDGEAVASLIAAFTLHHANPSTLGPELDFDLFLRKGLEQLQYPGEVAPNR